MLKVNSTHCPICWLFFHHIIDLLVKISFWYSCQCNWANQNWLDKTFPNIHNMDSTIRRVWRYQWEVIRIRISKNRQHNRQRKKVQKDKQRSTKHTHKTKDRVTWIPLKIWGELRCSGRVSSSCSSHGTHRVNLVTNPVISHEWGNDKRRIKDCLYLTNY
jgi:hypothetical protein